MQSPRLSTVAVALAALTLQLSAQTTLQGMGTTLSNPVVEDVSADGTAVVARSGGQAYVWTVATPTWTLIPGSQGATGLDVANGGAFVSATLPDPANGNLQTAARWSSSTGWLFIPSLGASSGTSTSSSYDISADGSTIVGLGWVSANIAHAFRWDLVGGTVDLGAFGGNSSSSRANAVSADGSTAVGWDADPITGVWRAARWNGVIENLLGSLEPSDPINGPSQAYVVSSNGQFIAGESPTGLYTPSGWNENHAFRWDAVNGLVDLGTTPVDPSGWGNHATIPTGISDDGRTLVGIAGISAFGPGVVRPMFIYREGSGMFLIKDYLVALGVPAAGQWTFNTITGMSSDGRVIVGLGRNPSNQVEPYRIVLAEQAQTYCTAKVNSQGCTPAIQAEGIASVSSTATFDITATNVLNNKNGLMYFGFSPASAPFQGGFQCVGAPTVRTPQQLSGGTLVGDDCSGAYALEFNALIQSGVAPQLVIGAKVHAQFWSRDPQSPSTSGLTNAVGFTIFP